MNHHTWERNGISGAKRKLMVLVLACLLPAVMIPALSEAQDFSGFRGRITDPSAAVISGATIKVTEEKSGLTKSTVSNELGEYELRGILPGTYTMEVEITGFKKYQNKGVIVYGRDVRRVDVKLELGEVATTVTVEEQGSRISTDTASVAYKTPNREVYSLNLSNMISQKFNNPGSEDWAQVHGGFANNTNTEQDGIPHNAWSAFQPPQEMLKEVNFVALNAPAEYRAATTIAGISKSGTNRPHGEVFTNFRHDRLNALSVGVLQRPKPQTGGHRESYNLSGPVFIPKLYDGRNKTFFHFLYQGNSDTSTSLRRGYIAPTLKMREGDFSEFAAATGKNIVDPFTGLPFANNIIPSTRISPVWNRMKSLGLVPAPNVVGGDLFRNNYEFLDSNKSTSKFFHTRIDHQLTSTNTLSLTILYANDSYDAIARNIPQDGGALYPSTTRAFSLQDSHTFSPRLVNEFTFSYNNQSECVPCQFGRRSTTGRKILQDELKIGLGGRLPPDAVGQPHFIFQTVGAGNELDILGAEIAGTLTFPERKLTFRDNVSIQRGKHLFKTGIDVGLQRPESFVVGGSGRVGGDSWGRFEYSGRFSGNDFADFLLDLPQFTSISTPRSRIVARQKELGFFVQDDWKITPRLTLTPGLRFQRYGEPYEVNGVFFNFDVAKQQVVVPDAGLKAVVPGYPIPVVSASQAGYPEHLANFKFLMAEPRLGIAWRPRDKSVVRAGYGMYHVPYTATITTAAGYRGDVAARGTDRRGARAGLIAGMEYGPFVLGESFGPNQIVNGTPSFTNSNPFPSLGKLGLQTVFAKPVDLRKDNWPLDQQWNLTLEQELPWAFSTRVSYVGSKGTHWPYVRDLQQPLPSTLPFSPDRRPFGSDKFLNIFLMDLGGNSTHHGLEMEVTRQFSRGLYFRSWYNWKKSLNDVLGGRLGDSVGSESENAYDRVREKGHQAGYAPHSSRFVAVYDLPVGRGQSHASGIPGWLNHIIGNWTAAPLVTINGGQRFTPFFSGADPANIGLSGGRADVISGCDPYSGNSAPGFFWNRKCFAVPPNGRFGTASRGFLGGRTSWNTDFNVFKKFNLTKIEEGPYLKLELYVQNFFNHANAAGPSSTTIDSANFGRFDFGGSRSMYIRVRIGF